MAPPRERIPKTGRLLIVLARTGQALTALSVLGATYVLFRIALPALPPGQGAIDVLRNAFSEPAAAFVNGWYLLRAAIYIWALERIRLIGTALLRFEPISTEVATAVRRSVQALLLCGFSTLLAFNVESNARCIVPTDTVIYSVAWDLNFMAFYAVCLLCVCVFAIARILQEAVALKAENEGFV